MNFFSVPGIIRGYHVYQRIWTPFVGEKATTAREPGNEHDHYTVAMLEDETLCTVGHLPREISREYSFFIRRGGVIGVEVTGPRQSPKYQKRAWKFHVYLPSHMIVIPICSRKPRNSWQSKVLKTNLNPETTLKTNQNTRKALKTRTIPNQGKGGS